MCVQVSHAWKQNDLANGQQHPDYSTIDISIYFIVGISTTTIFCYNTSTVIAAKAKSTTISFTWIAFI
jgi:hypothetical protein